MSFHTWFLKLSVEAMSLYGRRERSCRLNYSSKSKGSRAELLVDADTHSIDAIRSGIDMLKLEMGAVHTTIFAAPGFSQNKKWQKLFQEAGVSFHPVPRSPVHGGEPNDDAIITTVHKLCRSTAIECIALLVSDSDYVSVLQEAMRSDKVVVTLCPAARCRLIHTFEEIGVRVLRLPQRREEGPKIRAVLDENGGGHVLLAEGYRCDNFRRELHQAEAVADFLDRLGYRDKDSLSHGQEDSRYLVHPIANFWSTNALGPLTVFPYGLATEAAFRLVRKSTPLPVKLWTAPRARKAFFLPCTNRGRLTKTLASKFGSAIAFSIFQAGGPFLLQDSKDLVAQALRKLGYLDSSLNNDLAEALLVFVNNTHNKVALRKLDALPSQHDQAFAVQQALRDVFLSDASSGRWHMAPKDVALRDHLCKEGFLCDLAADRTVVFQAMRKYAKTKGLPDMKSYIGYSFRIMTGLNPNAARRGLVKFQC